MLTLNKYIENSNIGYFGTLYEDQDKEIFLFSGYGSELDSRFESCLEKIDVELKFSDEMICDEQGLYHYAQPAYYGEKLTWKLIDCTIWTKEDVESDIESYEYELTNNPNQADTFDIDFSVIGYKRLPAKYESGWHYGQDDNPETIYKSLCKTYDDIIFSIDNVGQFDVNFSVWVRESTNE